MRLPHPWRHFPTSRARALVIPRRFKVLDPSLRSATCGLSLSRCASALLLAALLGAAGGSVQAQGAGGTVQGITQAQLAEAVGLTQSSISRRLAGAQAFRTDELMAVAEFLGYSLVINLTESAA